MVRQVLLRSGVLALAVSLLPAAPAAARPAGQELLGPHGFLPLSISASGVVLGRTGDAYAVAGRAQAYTLLVVPEGSTATAAGIDDVGRVAGHLTDVAGGSTPVRWSAPDWEQVALDSGEGSTVTDVDRSGQVLLRAADDAASVWHEGDVTTVLELTGGALRTATALDSSGALLDGWSSPPRLWSRGRLVPLEVPASGSPSLVELAGGEVFGNVIDYGEGTPGRAVRWDRRGRLHELALPAGLDPAVATTFLEGANEHGVAVGSVCPDVSGTAGCDAAVWRNARVELREGDRAVAVNRRRDVVGTVPAAGGWPWVRTVLWSRLLR